MGLSARRLRRLRLSDANSWIGRGKIKGLLGHGEREEHPERPRRYSFPALKKSFRSVREIFALFTTNLMSEREASSRLLNRARHHHRTVDGHGHEVASTGSLTNPKYIGDKHIQPQVIQAQRETSK